MKENLKALGFEALYMVASICVAAISSLIQLIGRTYVSDYSSFIFSGKNYSYNLFFYFLGMLVFIGFMITGYIIFLRKKIKGINWSGISMKILFAVVAALFSVIMLFTVLISLILISGYDDMLPESMFKFTLFGWPVICFGFMIYAEIAAIMNK